MKGEVTSPNKKGVVKMEKESEMAEEKKRTFTDLLLKAEESQDNDELLAKVMDKDGNLKVDLGLPTDFEAEIMAGQMVEHLIAYAQNHEAWRSARNQADNARARQLFEQMNYNRLTVSIIQAQYPGAKVIADEIMSIRAKLAKANRQGATEGKA